MLCVVSTKKICNVAIIFSFWLHFSIVWAIISSSLNIFLDGLLIALKIWKWCHVICHLWSPSSTVSSCLLLFFISPTKSFIAFVVCLLFWQELHCLLYHCWIDGAFLTWQFCCVDLFDVNHVYIFNGTASTWASIVSLLMMLLFMDLF